MKKKTNLDMILLSLKKKVEEFHLELEKYDYAFFFRPKVVNFFRRFLFSIRKVFLFNQTKVRTEVQ